MRFAGVVALSTIVEVLDSIRSGDEASVSRLWNWFTPRLERFCAQWLRDENPSDFDEEDVVLSAFNAFCRAVMGGRYQSLKEPNEVWAILSTIAVRKALDRLKHARRRKRRGEMTRVEMQSLELDAFRGGEPSPELAALMADECVRLLELLPEKELQVLVGLKVDGYTNEEIAEQMGYTRRTIQRMLAVIRTIWEPERE